MQAIRPHRFNVAVAIALVAVAGACAEPRAVWEAAMTVCTKTIDFADNLAGLPCRIAKSFRTLPERMDPTCSECNKP